jgi:LAO/AO transport system kinase
MVALMDRDSVKPVLKGDARKLAALISRIEERDPTVKEVLKAIYPHTGRAYVIGVTGPGGSGKSTLIDRMIAEYRRRGKTVGVLAVDPSSLFSKGAVLGDRVRMRDHFLDPGVFIRSFATRGTPGGVSAAVRDAVHVLDAAGKDVLLVETIGVGQDELDIAGLVHLVLVVLTPALGDEIQAMKAGLSEIGDIVVVNKVDLPGAEAAIQQLESMLPGTLVIGTAAIKNQGISTLIDSIEEQRLGSHRNGNHQKRRVAVCRQELISLLREMAITRVQKTIDEGTLDREAKRIAEGQVDPYTIADALAKKIGL